MNPGIIWLPYIMSQTINTISYSGFTPSQTVSSRYATGFFPKQFKRKSKINKIFGIIY